MKELHVERIRLAADALLTHSFEGWFYGDSIGFEGLLAASDILDDPRWRSFAHGFIRGWATRATPYRESDNTAPGHVMCLLYERTRDDKVLNAAAGLAGFLASRRRIAGVSVTFAQTPLCVPYGSVPLPPNEAALLQDAGAGIFIDCLHFDPPFFAHLGRLLGKDQYVRAGIDQALGYGRLLQDDTSGLFFHFWLEKTTRPYVLGWSRGQGWALLGMLDVIEYTDSGEPGRDELIERSRRLAETMRVLQRDDGHWWAVAHEPASRDETSTAAFMALAFGRGIELGVLDAISFTPALSKAWAAAWAAVDDRGALTGVSAAVMCSTAPGHYHHVPTGFIVPWGQGPLLLAARARLGSRSAPVGVS